MENKTIVVNLFAGPGAGKSTGAAYIFSKLKLIGINAELVTEFAKDLVWSKSLDVFNNQIHVYGEQSFRISRLDKQVKVIITDSPLLMSSCYCSKDVAYYNEFCDMVAKDFNQYNNINYFIKRVKKYNPNGRMQDEDGAKIKDAEIQAHMKRYGVDYKIIEGCQDGYDKIFEEVMSIIEDKN